MNKQYLEKPEKNENLMGFEKNKKIYRKFGNEHVRVLYDGKIIDFKAKIEFRWANHLELLKRSGQIKRWEYETHTFRFDNKILKKWIIDFVVRNNDDSFEYHETKGRFQGKDWNKLELLFDERPEVKLTYIFASKPKISATRFEKMNRWCKRVITNANTIFRKEPTLLEELGL